MTAPGTEIAEPVMGARVTVLIVDDEPPARRGLRHLLEQHADLQIIGEARNGRKRSTRSAHSGRR